MTLNELLDKLTPLRAEHGDKPVVMEGCDCAHTVDDIGGDKSRIYLLRYHTTSFTIECVADGEVVHFE